MKLVLNVILFLSLGLRPCLLRLKDIGSRNPKKVFPLRTIVSVLSSEILLENSEAQHWSVLCFCISVLTTCPGAVSMQYSSCLGWERTLGNHDVAEQLARV